MTDEGTNVYELAQSPGTIADKIFKLFHPSVPSTPTSLVSQPGHMTSRCRGEFSGGCSMANNSEPCCPASLLAQPNTYSSHVGASRHTPEGNLAVSFDDLTNDQILYDNLHAIKRMNSLHGKKKSDRFTKVIGVICIMNFVATSAGLAYFTWKLMQLESLNMGYESQGLGRWHLTEDRTSAFVRVDQNTAYNVNDTALQTLQWKGTGETRYIGSNISVTNEGLKVEVAGVYVVFTQLRYQNGASQSKLLTQEIHRKDAYNTDMGPIAAEELKIDGAKQSEGGRLTQFQTSRLFQLVYLRAGEQLVVKVTHRSLIIEGPDKSFFGMYRYN